MSYAGRAFFWGFLALLAWRMTRIGWGEIARVLPDSPWFYAISLVLYVQLTAAHALAYRVTWRFPFWEGANAFFKMVVFNKEIVGNAGEAYLCLWARKHLQLPTASILRIIKDNIVLQWLCETTWAFGLPVALLLGGWVLPPMTERYAVYAIASPIVLSICLAFVFCVRRVLFSMTDRAMATVAFIHLGRLILVNLLCLAQWSLAIPDATVQVRLTMLACWNLLNWIPYLPNKSLFILYAGIEAAESMGLPTAVIAGMLLVNSMLDKSLNLVLFPLCDMLDRAGPQSEDIAAPATNLGA